MPIASTDTLYIKTSTIHGKGLFSKKEFKKGDIIIENVFPNKPPNKRLYSPIPKSLFYKYINPFARYINNSSINYNAKLCSKKYILFQLKAIKNISENEEITSDYKSTNKEFPFIAGIECIT